MASKDNPIGAFGFCVFCGTQFISKKSKKQHNCWSKKETSVDAD